MARKDRHPDLSGIFVLLVEDHDDTRDVLTAVLTHANALVLAVADAETAARHARHILPDVVLTDLALPSRSGYWLLTELRALDPKLPVALLTSYAGVREWAMRAGYSTVLEKPIEADALWAAVARLAAADRRLRPGESDTRP